MRDEILNVLLDVLRLLKPCVLVVRGSNPLDRYLIMLDERIHSAEGGLEGREPVGGLLRNIEEYLHTICNPLLLCWEPPAINELTTYGVQSTHIG